MRGSDRRTELLNRSDTALAQAPTPARCRESLLDEIGEGVEEFEDVDPPCGVVISVPGQYGYVSLEGGAEEEHTGFLEVSKFAPPSGDEGPQALGFLADEVVEFRDLGMAVRHWRPLLAQLHGEAGDVEDQLVVAPEDFSAGSVLVDDPVLSDLEGWLGEVLDAEGDDCSDEGGYECGVHWLASGWGVTAGTVAASRGGRS